MIEFLKEASWEEADKFIEELDKKKINYGMITEWGCTIPEDANFIIELGEEGEPNYIATKGFLQRSEDGVFVRLMKDGKKGNMPNFEDIFEIIDLSKNHKELRLKEDFTSCPIKKKKKGEWIVK